MRSTIVIVKSGNHYIANVKGKYGGGFSGAVAGKNPDEAASNAISYMVAYAQPNPEGGDLVAPPEVIELVPQHLRAFEPFLSR